MSVCVCVCVCVCICVNTAACLSIYLSFYLPAGVPLCLSTCLSACLSVSLYVYLSVFLSRCLCVCVCVCVLVYTRVIDMFRLISSVHACVRTCGVCIRLSVFVSVWAECSTLNQFGKSVDGSSLMAAPPSSRELCRDLIQKRRGIV